MGIIDRNGRILIVFSIIGSIIVSSKYIFNIFFNIFTYMHAQYGIGVEHLFSVSLLTNWFFIFGLAIIYCYFEAHTFSNYPKGKEEMYKEKSDKFYQKLINSFFLCLIITSTSLITTTMVKSLLELAYLLFVLFLIAVISFIFIRIFKERISMLNIINLKILDIKNNPFINLLTYWLIIFISIFTTAALLGISSNLNSELKIKFSDVNKDIVELYIEFSDSISNRMPEEFTIYIYNEGRQEIKTNKQEFTFSMTEAKEVDNNKLFFIFERKTEKHLLKPARYKAVNKINLSNYLDIGVNTIEILFDVKDMVYETSKINYRVINQIIVSESGIEINEERFDFRI